MRRPYSRPVLVEYGSVDRLTLGEGGNEPDFRIDPGGALKQINTTCEAGGTATACLVPLSPRP